MSAAGGPDCTITLQGASRPLPLVSCGTAYVLQFVNGKTFNYFISLLFYPLWTLDRSVSILSMTHRPNKGIVTPDYTRIVTPTPIGWRRRVL